jgi:hypothetical protein
VRLRASDTQLRSRDGRLHTVVPPRHVHFGKASLIYLRHVLEPSPARGDDVAAPLSQRSVRHGFCETGYDDVS